MTRGVGKRFVEQLPIEQRHKGVRPGLVDGGVVAAGVDMPWPVWTGGQAIDIRLVPVLLSGEAPVDVAVHTPPVWEAINKPDAPPSSGRMSLTWPECQTSSAWFIKMPYGLASLPGHTHDVAHTTTIPPEPGPG